MLGHRNFIQAENRVSNLRGQIKMLASKKIVGEYDLEHSSDEDIKALIQNETFLYPKKPNVRIYLQALFSLLKWDDRGPLH